MNIYVLDKDNVTTTECTPALFDPVPRDEAIDEKMKMSNTVSVKFENCDVFDWTFVLPAEIQPEFVEHPPKIGDTESPSIFDGSSVNVRKRVSCSRSASLRNQISVPLRFPGAAIRAAPRFAIQTMEPLLSTIISDDGPDSTIAISSGTRETDVSSSKLLRLICISSREETRCVAALRNTPLAALASPGTPSPDP